MKKAIDIFKEEFSHVRHNVNFSLKSSVKKVDGDLDKVYADLKSAESYLKSVNDAIVSSGREAIKAAPDYKDEISKIVNSSIEDLDIILKDTTHSLKSVKELQDIFMGNMGELADNM